MLELAVQAGEAASTIGIALGAFFSGALIQWKRNGRRGNPGPNANDYHYRGKRGSDSPGLGKVCREHNDGISDNRAAIAALRANMETYSEQVAVIFKQLGKIQGDVTTLVERVGD